MARRLGSRSVLGTPLEHRGPPLIDEHHDLGFGSFARSILDIGDSKCPGQPCGSRGPLTPFETKWADGARQLGYSTLIHTYRKPQSKSAEISYTVQPWSLTPAAIAGVVFLPSELCVRAKL